MNTKILASIGTLALLSSVSMNVYLITEVQALKLNSQRYDRMNAYQVDINDWLIEDVITMKMMLGISNPENGWTEEDEKRFDELSKPVEPQSEKDVNSFEKLRNVLPSLSGRKIVAAQ